MSGRDEVSVLVDVDLGDLVTLGRLEDKPLAGLDLLDDDLGEGYVSELELALVAGLFEADVEDVDGSTERANADPRAVLLPGDRSHGVVVLYLLAANFVPLWSLGVEVVDVEPVEVSDHGGLTAGVEGGAGELLHLLVLGVVESLEAVPRGLVEGDPAVVTGCEDVGTPGEGVRD